MVDNIDLEIKFHWNLMNVSKYNGTVAMWKPIMKKKIIRIRSINVIVKHTLWCDKLQAISTNKLILANFASSVQDICHFHKDLCLWWQFPFHKNNPCIRRDESTPQTIQSSKQHQWIINRDNGRSVTVISS